MFSSRCTQRTAKCRMIAGLGWRPYSSMTKPTTRRPVKPAFVQSSQSWNPAIRALAGKSQATLLYRSRDVTPRTVCRLFIGVSGFVMAAHCALICVDPPENFSPVLRRFMVVVAIVTGGVGLAALFRNTLAVKSIVAVPSGRASLSRPNAITLRIETTKWPPWRAGVIMAQPREVSLSQPLRAARPTNLATHDISAVKIALRLPLMLLVSQFRHLWDTVREIVYTDDTVMTIEGRAEVLRVDETPAFSADGVISLNNIVRHDL